jgi:hypothetical protein
MISNAPYALERGHELLSRLNKWNSRGYMVPLPDGGVTIVFTNISQSKKIRYVIPSCFRKKEFLTFEDDDGDVKHVYNPSFFTVIKFIEELNGHY